MTIKRKIKRVIDGDTFQTYRKIQGTNRIRLANVNAPEKGQKGYSVAKQRLNKYKNKTVTITPKGRSYGRLVAETRYKKKMIK
jgi:endonuclease YncB( thermonuclease family)